MKGNNTIVGVATIVALVMTSAGLWVQNRHLKEELAQLRSAAIERDRLREENAALVRAQVDSNELARLRASQSELARLRNLVSQMRKSSQAPSPLPSPGSLADTRSTSPTNNSHAFNSSVQARIPSGQTLAVGGWSYQPGKRLLSLVKPTVGAPPNETGQILIATTLVEMPESVWASLGLAQQNNSSSDQNSFQSLLDSTQSRDFLSALTNHPGVNILGSPRVVHTEGVPASIYVGDPQGASQSLEFKSRLSADGKEVDLEMNLEIFSSPSQDTPPP